MVIDGLSDMKDLEVDLEIGVLRVKDFFVLLEDIEDKLSE